MTESPESTPLAFDGPDDVLLLLRGSGHRVSAACRIVLEFLFEADGPVSAQFIAEGGRAGKAPLETTSVYRNLERLEALGVVKHVHLGHGPGLYMLVGSGEKEYLACERCNRVTSLDPSELESVRSQIWERFGYRARFGHFPIIGLCASCAASAQLGAIDVAPGESARNDHVHEHSHGDYVHSHPHIRREGVDGEHAHNQDD